MKTNLNILIIQTAFIGDIALSVFFANEIKQISPTSSIYFVSTKIGCEILKCFDFIAQPIVFDKRKSHKGLTGIKNLSKQINLINTINKTEFAKFDYIFALHRSFRTAILTQLIKAKNKIGFDINSFSFLLSKKIQYKKHIHEVPRNRNCLSIFDNFDENFDYENAVKSIASGFKIADKENELLKEIIYNPITEKTSTSEKKKYILVAAGSVWATKRWKKEYFSELCKKIINELKIEVYLIGSENEQEICDFISNESKAVSLAGKTTIPQILELTKNSLLVITNDSAPTHFASIFNIPTVTIFGATSPIFGFSPLAKNSKIIEQQNLFCHPCSIHGEKKCPQKTFDCMNNIKPEMVFNEVKNLFCQLHL